MIESLRTKTPLFWCYSLSLLLFAVWLRWDITPKTYFADELIPLAVVSHMQDSNTLDTNWEKADWRGDFAGGFYKLHQYNFSSYLSSLFWLRTGADSVGLERVPDLTLYRLASLACQLGCLLLVFFIANQLAGSTAGLLAASFIAVMPQAVVDAHYARPESFVTLLVAIGCWLALQVDQRRSGLTAFLEAFVWGVAFACKFSFFPMALLACGTRLVRQRYVHVFWLWCAGFVAGIALTAPYILLDIDGFFHGVRLLLDQYKPQPATLGWFASVFPSAHQLFPYLAVFFGMPVLILLAVSCRQQKIKARCFTGVCLLVSLFYVLLFSHQGVFFERNLSHLLPLWSVLFALGFVESFRSLKKPWQLVAVALLFLLWPLYLSVQIDRYFFRNLETVKQGVSHYEQGIQAQFESGRVAVFPVMGDQAVVDKLGKNDILRVPQYKLDGLLQVNRELKNKHFYQVAAVDLPLSYLPYNQLQINHFPPAYAYYLREPVANAEGAP